MKFLICLCLVIPSAALFTSSGFGDELFDPKASHDAGSVIQKLSGMVASAQQKLSLAERHHKKVVKRIRKESADMLHEAAKIFGDGIHDYSAELSQSVDELENAVRDAKAGLAQSEATPSKLSDWRDPEVEKRAQLGAKLASADRSIKKAERRRLRAVREAEETAEETVEEEGQKLGMKLGDMTPLVDKAKETLEADAERKPVTTNSTANNASAPSASKKKDLKSLEDELAKAVAKNAAVTKDANTKLQGFLAKQGKDVAAKAATINEDLQASQQQEIEKVIGKKITEKPRSVSKGISKTSAPAAKTAEKKIAPVATRATTKSVSAEATKAAMPVAKKVEPAASHAPKIMAKPTSAAKETSKASTPVAKPTEKKVAPVATRATTKSLSAEATNAAVPVAKKVEPAASHAPKIVAKPTSVAKETSKASTPVAKPTEKKVAPVATHATTKNVSVEVTNAAVTHPATQEVAAKPATVATPIAKKEGAAVKSSK